MRHEHCSSYNSIRIVILVQYEIHGSLQEQNTDKVVVLVHAFVKL